MAEDLSEWIGFGSDGAPRPKRALTCLPKMETPTPGGKPQQKIVAVKPQAKGGKKDTPKRKATFDRFATLNAFVDASIFDLNRGEIAVWLVLYRDTRDGTVRTSQPNIARRAGLSVRAVRYAIQNLIKAGLLVVVFQGGLNRGATRYRVEPLRKPTSSALRQKNVSD